MFHLKGVRLLGLFCIMFSVARFQPAVVASRNNFESSTWDYTPPQTHPPAPDSIRNEFESSTWDYTPPQTHPPAPDAMKNGFQSSTWDYTPPETHPPAPDTMRTWAEIVTPSSKLQFIRKPRNSLVPPSGVPAPGDF